MDLAVTGTEALAGWTPGLGLATDAMDDDVPPGMPAAASELMGVLLATMRMGALLVTPDGHVIAANAAGREALQARYGLALRNGQVFALAADARRRLAQVLIRASQPPYVDAALTLVAGDGSGRVSSLRVVSMERYATRIRRSSGGLVLLCIAGPRSRAPDAGTLAQLYGLTPAEGALMAAIAAGRRLRDCATQRGVALATVRAQLRNVFVKTGAGTQAELTLIAWSVPGLWLD